jgi:DNA-binding transcriptional ArsR family regulator
MSPPAERMTGSRDEAAMFAALGDETRLAILSRLSTEGPLSIARLTERSNITRQGLTKHLVALADAGLVRDEKLGRERIWEVDPKSLARARQCLDRISMQWDEAIQRLKTLVEDEP